MGGFSPPWKGKYKMSKGKKIVVFGCDNTGKTTLCNDLLEEFNDYGGLSGKTVLAKSIGPNKTKKQYIQFMEAFLNSNDNVIFERFPLIEEVVYGNILRGKNIFDSEDGDMIYRCFNCVDLYIFCYPGLLNILNFGKREQMEGVIENSIDIINGFNRVVELLLKQGFDVMEYNYQIHGNGIPNQWFVENIVRRLEHKR